MPEDVMALISAAIAAKADQAAGTVRFTMKSGAKFVAIQVSEAALRAVDPSAMDRAGSFETFKSYRKYFERIASHKYDFGNLEHDGSVHIRPRDVPEKSG
jgi:hypothetical protein